MDGCAFYIMHIHNSIYNTYVFIHIYFYIVKMYYKPDFTRQIRN